MDHWGYLEADLLEHYGVMDPLQLSWRKLLVLINGLFPDTSRLHMVLKATDPMRALDRAMGRDPDRPRRRVSLDEFSKGI